MTFLIPAFAVALGRLFLDERLTLPMVAGCAVILIGTALATGVLGGRRPRGPSRADAIGAGADAIGACRPRVGRRRQAERGARGDDGAVRRHVGEEDARSASPSGAARS